MKERIHELMQKGNLDEIKEYIKSNPTSLSVRDAGGAVALHYAMQRGEPDIVRYLLARKEVDRHPRSNAGVTPLHAAVIKNNPELLMDYELDEEVDTKAPFLLHIVANNNCRIKVFEHCIRIGCNANTPLSLANDSLGALNIHNTMTPFMIACSKGHKILARFMLDRYGDSLDASILDHKGCSMLRWALELREVDMLEKCLRLGISVDAQDLDGFSCLHWTSIYAAKNMGFWKEGAVSLIFYGANTSLKTQDNERGMTALGIAAFGQNASALEAVETLLEHDVDCNIPSSVTISASPLSLPPLWIAVSAGNLDAAASLVQNTRGSNTRQEGGNTLLHLVMRNERGMECAKKLLAKHPWMLNDKNGEGGTPILGAAVANQVKNIEFLLSRGANLDIISDNGMHTVHWAAMYGSTDALQVLFEHDQALVTIQDTARNTPLRTAITHNKFSTASAIVSRYTTDTINTKNARYETALYLALQKFAETRTQDAKDCIKAIASLASFEDIDYGHHSASEVAGILRIEDSEVLGLLGASANPAVQALEAA
ncbi:MAG: ankyrin repeat domain-containing protein [Pseudomonadota bacterium]